MGYSGNEFLPMAEGVVELKLKIQIRSLYVFVSFAGSYS